MSQPAQQLLGELSRYGLLCRTSPEDAWRSLEIDERSDRDLVVSRLVDRGHLTEFQGRVIRAGQIPHLLVDQYVVLDKLGEGGMGVVFKARHKLMDRLVAIKLLTPELSRRPELARRFHREIKTQSKLAHPTIVAAFDAGEVRGSLYLVMEYVDGDNLANLVRSRGPFSPVEALQITRQAALGLAFAHRFGIVHRDIKPQNLLLDRSGRLKILDFGLARLCWSSEVGLERPESRETSADPAQEHRLVRPELSELTMAGQIMGTVDYMAPEQVLDSRSVDGRSDLYSLGCTLHFLLTGQVVFPGKSAIEKVIAHRESPVPSLTGFLSSYPPASAKSLDGVFRRMVAKERTDRFETAGELADAIRNTIASFEPKGVAQPAAPPPTPGSDAGTSPNRSPPPTLNPSPRKTGSAGTTRARPELVARSRPRHPAFPQAAESPPRPPSDPRPNPDDPPRNISDSGVTDSQLESEEVDDEFSDSELPTSPPFWTQARIAVTLLVLLGVGGSAAYYFRSQPRAAQMRIESSGDIVPEVDAPHGDADEPARPTPGNLKRKFKL